MTLSHALWHLCETLAVHKRLQVHKGVLIFYWGRFAPFYALWTFTTLKGHIDQWRSCGLPLFTIIILTLIFRQEKWLLAWYEVQQNNQTRLETTINGINKSHMALEHTLRIILHSSEVVLVNSERRGWNDAELDLFYVYTSVIVS